MCNRISLDVPPLFGLHPSVGENASFVAYFLKAAATTAEEVETLEGHKRRPFFSTIHHCREAGGRLSP
jgi:hypothetical protein